MRAVVVPAITLFLAATGTALAAPDLAAYAGKYPSDKVGGVTFLKHPAVVAGVKQAVPSAAVRKWVLSPETVQSPIFDSGGVLLSQACEPHNCGDHAWTILIHIETGATDVCYHDAAEMGPTGRAGTWQQGRTRCGTAAALRDDAGSPRTIRGRISRDSALVTGHWHRYNRRLPSRPADQRACRGGSEASTRSGR